MTLLLLINIYDNVPCRLKRKENCDKEATTPHHIKGKERSDEETTTPHRVERKENHEEMRALVT
jgi:hypothetical protein